jgi:hypothetical protein
MIKLLDGPMAGTKHKLHGRIRPAKFGLPVGDAMHWYVIGANGRNAEYERTTPRVDRNDDGLLIGGPTYGPH